MILVRGWLTQTKDLLSFGYFVSTSSITPVILTAITAYLFRAGDRPDALLYAAIGAGMMGAWTTTQVGSGQALTLLRHAGVLELLVVAPTPFLLVLIPITVATATVGLLALVATLTSGWLLLDIPIAVHDPVLLLLALPATALSLGMLGMLLATAFVRFRYANALTNLLNYPVWLASGVLVPLSLLPDWVRPISWLLPPTWGVQAIRDSMLGGRPLPAIGACLALALGYLALSMLSLRLFERSARRHATLALA